MIATAMRMMKVHLKKPTMVLKAGQIVLKKGFLKKAS